MNNEPVAWMDGEGGFYHNDDYEVCKEHNISDDLIPLYTQQRPHNTVLVPCDKLAEMQAEIEALKQTIEWLADINEMRFLELSDGELPVLYVTLNHNGNRIQGNVSLQETRIICNSIANEIKKKSTAILRKAQDK